MTKYLVGAKMFLPSLNSMNYILLPIVPVDINLFDMFEEVYLLDPLIATAAEKNVRYFTITPDVRKYVKGIRCEELYQMGFRRIIKQVEFQEMISIIKSSI